MAFDNPVESGKSGRARMKEISAENAAAVQLWKSGLLAGLGRTWTAAEEMTAEMIAGLFVRAGKLRAQGRDDTELLYRAATLMRDSVFRDPRVYQTPGASAMDSPESAA